MALRYIDTNFFASPYVRSLPAPLKSLYCFIICNASGAGIWTVDFEVAAIYTGYQITEAEARKFFVESKKAVELPGGRWFFPDFIEHQYPSGLSKTNPAHKNFIKELLKFNLLTETNEGTLEVLQRDLIVPLVMVTVMEKVMVKEKVIEASEKKIETPDLIYPYTSDKFMQVWGELIRGPKWKRKTKAALQASLVQISQYSEGSEATAIQIMMNSLAGNWQGVFPIDKKNQQLNRYDTEQQRKQGVADLRAAIHANLAGQNQGNG